MRSDLRRNLLPSLLLGAAACEGCPDPNEPNPPDCTNAAAAITSPAADATIQVYQAFQLVGTGGSPECDALLVWYVDGVAVSTGNGDPTTLNVGTGNGAIAPGRTIIDLEVRRVSQVLSTTERRIWITLPRELLYDVGEAAIWRTDAKDNVQVTTGGNPAWSPADPNRIAFQRNDATDGEIWVINRDGSGEQQITNNAVDDFAPSWSGDGVRLAYNREISGTTEIVVQLPTPGLNPALLTSNNFNDDSPHWVGNLILYNADNGGTSRIYTLRGDLPPFQTPAMIQNTTNGIDPRWNNLASQLVFSRPQPGNPTAHQLVLIDAGGNTPNLISFAPTTAHSREPDISPEGLIAFVSNAGGSVERLWITNTNTGAQPLLVRGLPTGARHPRWRP